MDVEPNSKSMENTSRRPHNPRPETLKRINMRRFLEELRRRGPSTRADLTRATGVTPPTSSSIIADLVAVGLLEESEGGLAARGRPGKVFRLASSTAYVVGATIDIFECAAAAAGLDSHPRPETKATFATPNTYESLVASIVSQTRQIQDQTQGRCLGVGIAVPGLVDERHGRVAFSPNLHFLDGRDLGADLERHLGVDVILTQEEHALCLSEQHLGRASGHSDFAIMDFSSGVGMGVVSGGRYVAGAQGYAGEIGHTTVEPYGILCGCGNRGCLETVASDTALLRSVSARVGRQVGFSDLADLDATKEVDRALDYIAIGIATVVNLFNPSAVFVHGRIFQLREGLITEVAERTKARALKPSAEPLEVRLAEGNKLYGATAGLLDHLFALVGPTLA